MEYGDDAALSATTYRTVSCRYVDEIVGKFDTSREGKNKIQTEFSRRQVIDIVDMLSGKINDWNL